MHFNCLKEVIDKKNKNNIYYLFVIRLKVLIISLLIYHRTSI